MRKRKLPPVDELISLFKSHTAKEIAAMYGTTHQAVSHQLRLAGHAIKTKVRERQAKASELFQQGASLEEVARETGYKMSYVDMLARRHGIRRGHPRKPIGCEDCQTKPYARGMCKNCHTRWCRWGQGKVKAPR